MRLMIPLRRENKTSTQITQEKRATEENLEEENISSSQKNQKSLINGMSSLWALKEGKAFIIRLERREGTHTTQTAAHTQMQGLEYHGRLRSSSGRLG